MASPIKGSPDWGAKGCGPPVRLFQVTEAIRSTAMPTVPSDEAAAVTARSRSGGDFVTAFVPCSDPAG